MSTTTINTHYGVNIAWIVYRNGYNAFVGTLTLDGDAYDITPYTFSAYIRTPNGTEDKLTLTEGSGITNGGAAGTLTIALTEAQLATLLRDRYFIVIEYTIDSKDYPLCQGYITISDEANPGTTTTTATIPVSIEGTAVSMAITMPSLAAAKAYTDAQIALAVFDNNITTISPEYFGAIGDGSTDDAVALQLWADYICVYANKIIGVSRAAAYMTSAEITFTNHPTINFPGTIKRTTASTASSIVRFSFGSNAFTSVHINVDGNSANSNDCVGITVDQGLNTKCDLNFGARYCTTGVKLTGNFERARVACFVDYNDVGVDVHNDGSSATPDELHVSVYGSANRTAFIASGTQKTSGTVFLCHEQGGEDYAVIIRTGVWIISGEVRGSNGGVQVYNAAQDSAPLHVHFDHLMLYGESANTLEAMFVDASVCLISGQVHLNRHTYGVWIKRMRAGSSLQLNRVSATSATDFGLKLGSAAESKSAAGFTLLEGSVLAGEPALSLDSCTLCTLNVSQIIDGTSAIVIGSGSSKNSIRLESFLKAKTITNNRTQKDNLILYTGVMTEAEMNAISSPFKGFKCEAVDDGDKLVTMTYNGTTAAWE